MLLNHNSLYSTRQQKNKQGLKNELFKLKPNSHIIIQVISGLNV